MCKYCDDKQKSIQRGNDLNEVSQATALRKYYPWTAREDKIVVSDRPMKEIAIELGRTYFAVVTRRNVLSGPKNRPYSAKEDELIMRTDIPAADIAAALKRTRNAVYVRRHNLRLYAQGHNNATP